MKVFIDNIIIDGQDKGELYIDSDERNYMVNVYNGKTDKQGKAVFTNKGYYTTLASAAKEIVKMEIHRSTASTLHELIRDVERIERYIESKITF